MNQMDLVLQKLDKLIEDVQGIGRVVWSTKEGCAIRAIQSKMDDMRKIREIKRADKDLIKKKRE